MIAALVYDDNTLILLSHCLYMMTHVNSCGLTSVLRSVSSLIMELWLYTHIASILICGVLVYQDYLVAQLLKRSWVEKLNESIGPNNILCMMSCPSDCDPPTQDQYVFIHDAVLESLTCGDTQIPASGLASAIKTLKEKNRETGRTGFETQFHVCNTHE